jgi:hypothetical protein
LNHEVTTGAEGIELVESKDYIDEKSGRPGRYTKKVYHLESRVPGWVKVIAPSSALKLDEESWDAFPYSKTTITNRFFGERFSMTIESRHFDMDKGEQENALELPEDVLKKRVIHKMDIGAEQPTDKNEYKESEDPRLFKSGPFADKYQALTEGWQDRTETYMCCYKVVTVLFKIWGVQGKGESYLMDLETQIFLKFHKEIFCWLDDWYGLSLEDIIARETSFYEEMGDKLEVDEANGEGGKKQKKGKKSKKSSDEAEASSSGAASPAAEPRPTSPEPASDAAASSSTDASESSSKTKKSKKKKDKDAETEGDSTSTELTESSETPAPTKKSKKAVTAE